MLPFLYVHKHTHVCAYICIHKNVSLYLFFPTSSMEYLSLLHAIIQFYFLLNYVPFMQAQFIMWISQTTNAGTTRRKSDLLGRLDSLEWLSYTPWYWYIIQRKWSVGDSVAVIENWSVLVILRKCYFNFQKGMGKTRIS